MYCGKVDYRKRILSCFVFENIVAPNYLSGLILRKQEVSANIATQRKHMGKGWPELLALVGHLTSFLLHCCKGASFYTISGKSCPFLT